MRALVLSVLAVLAISGAAGGAEHPYLFFQKADIPALRAKVAADPVAKAAMAELIGRLEKHSSIVLPAVNADIRHGWARAIYGSGRAGQHAAFAYLMTGERKYLDIAREYLLTFARRFDDRVNFHVLDDKSYMRIYFTGFLGVSAAWTYDMIYDELTDDERRLVEEKLLRGIARMVKDSHGENASDGNAMSVADYEWNGGQWNGVVYGNTGVAAVGFALNDAELIEHAVGNWKTYIARDMLTDGLYQEEDYVYSNFCMGSLVMLAEMAGQSGYRENLWTLKVPAKPYDQWDNRYGSTFPSEGADPGFRTLKSYFDALLDYQYPTLAAGNWGWQMNKASFTNNHSYATFYELAYRRYEEPGYAWFLNRMNRSRGCWLAWGPISPILYHQPLPADVAPRPTTSRWYDHSKWIALKSVEGSDYWGSDALYAFMPYGPYRTKALQRLSVDLFAFGKVVAPRVAKTSRHQSAEAAYYLNADDWNNMKVDGENISIRRSKITDSRMRFCEFSPEIKIAQPVLTIERHVRPSIWSEEISERRSDLDYVTGRALALTDTYLLDITHARFVQEPDRRHNFHWLWHGTGNLTLEGVKHDHLTHDAWSAVWRDDDGVGLKTTLLGSGPARNTKVLWCASPQTQYVKALRSETSPVFAAVHEPFRGEPRITNIEQLPTDDDRLAVRVEAPDFTDILCVAFDAEGLALDTEDVTVTVDSHYAYLRLAGATLTARGDIRAFRLKAEGIETVVVNGRTAPFEKGESYVEYQRDK